MPIRRLAQGSRKKIGITPDARHEVIRHHHAKATFAGEWAQGAGRSLGHRNPKELIPRYQPGKGHLPGELTKPFFIEKDNNNKKKWYHMLDRNMTRTIMAARAYKIKGEAQSETETPAI